MKLGSPNNPEGYLCLWLNPCQSDFWTWIETTYRPNHGPLNHPGSHDTKQGPSCTRINNTPHGKPRCCRERTSSFKRTRPRWCPNTEVPLFRPSAARSWRQAAPLWSAQGRQLPEPASDTCCCSSAAFALGSTAMVTVII